MAQLLKPIEQKILAYLFSKPRRRFTPVEILRGIGGPQEDLHNQKEYFD